MNRNWYEMKWNVRVIEWLVIIISSTSTSCRLIYWSFRLIAAACQLNLLLKWHRQIYFRSSSWIYRATHSKPTDRRTTNQLISAYVHMYLIISLHDIGYQTMSVHYIYMLCIILIFMIRNVHFDPHKMHTCIMASALFAHCLSVYEANDIISHAILLLGREKKTLQQISIIRSWKTRTFVINNEENLHLHTNTVFTSFRFKLIKQNWRQRKHFVNFPYFYLYNAENWWYFDEML